MKIGFLIYDKEIIVSLGIKYYLRSVIGPYYLYNISKNKNDIANNLNKMFSYNLDYVIFIADDSLKGDTIIDELKSAFINKISVLFVNNNGVKKKQRRFDDFHFLSKPIARVDLLEEIERIFMRLNTKLEWFEES